MTLVVADRAVIVAGIAGDDRQRVGFGHVTAGLADDDCHFPLEVEHVGRVGLDHRLAVADLRIGKTRKDHRPFRDITAAFEHVAAIVQADGHDFVGIGNDRQEFDFVEAVIGAFARCGFGDDVERTGGNRAAQGLWPAGQGLRINDAVIGDDAIRFRAVNCVSSDLHAALRLSVEA